PRSAVGCADALQCSRDTAGGQLGLRPLTRPPFIEGSLALTTMTVSHCALRQPTRGFEEETSLLVCIILASSISVLRSARKHLLDNKCSCVASNSLSGYPSGTQADATIQQVQAQRIQQHDECDDDRISC